jgi:AraC family transcriptional regulator of adaptative response/methylated-DNA-[protein]-cysteine methyltransferase
MSTMKLDTPNFDIVATAIKYLNDKNGNATLGELSKEVHVSPFHLQRLFVDWAGVSPKEFGQAMRHARAKALIRSQSVLESAYTLGLSSPSRLHDLFLSVEAMTPGESKNFGSELTIRWGVYETPFGNALFASTPRGLCRLSFLEGPEQAQAELKREWPNATLVHDPKQLEATVNEVVRRMEGASPAASIGVVMSGSPFRLQVWKALIEVPRGQVISYSKLAENIGRGKAVRAVASSVAINPLAYLIPCHRVIRASGALGEYKWGDNRKAAMIGMESLAVA